MMSLLITVVLICCCSVMILSVALAIYFLNRAKSTERKMDELKEHYSSDLKRMKKNMDEILDSESKASKSNRIIGFASKEAS